METKNVAIIAVAVVAIAGIGGGVYYMSTQQKLETTPAPITQVVASPSIVAASPFVPAASSDVTAQPVVETPEKTVSNIQTVVMNTSSSGPDVALLSNQTSFSSEAPVIYSTVFLTPTTTDTKAILTVTYAVDSSTLGPVSATIKTQGNQKYATFQMTKPPTGWPKGSYTASFVTNSGDGHDSQFTVN